MAISPRVPKRVRKLTAVLIGLTLTAAATAAYLFASNYVEQEGVNELSLAAPRVIALFWLAALIPADLLLPRISRTGGPFLRLLAASDALAVATTPKIAQVA